MGFALELAGSNGSWFFDTGVVAAIRKLGELREAGLLTEEEFQRKKTELLDRL